MYYDAYTLQNELNAGGFECYNLPVQLDNNKVLGALQLLTTKILELETLNGIKDGEILDMKSKLENLEATQEEYKLLFRKMGKDYPEVVLAKPHLFAEEVLEAPK